MLCQCPLEPYSKVSQLPEHFAFPEYIHFFLPGYRSEMPEKVSSPHHWGTTLNNTWGDRYITIPPPYLMDGEAARGMCHMHWIPELSNALSSHYHQRHYLPGVPFGCLTFLAYFPSPLHQSWDYVPNKCFHLNVCLKERFWETQTHTNGLRSVCTCASWYWHLWEREGDTHCHKSSIKNVILKDSIFSANSNCHKFSRDFMLKFTMSGFCVDLV